MTVRAGEGKEGTERSTHRVCSLEPLLREDLVSGLQWHRLVFQSCTEITSYSKATLTSLRVQKLQWHSFRKAWF